MSEVSENKIEEIKQVEKSRGRIEKRKYELYKNIDRELKSHWAGIEQIIKVHRIRIINKEKSEETSYYITNKKAELSELSLGIRNHWLIENSLHWVKDETFGEDRTRHKENIISTIKSVLINIAMNALRKNENKYLKRTMRLCCNDIKKLMSFLE